MTNSEYANGLRLLADLLENNPGMEQPYEGSEFADIHFMSHSREKFAATVKAFGGGKKVNDDTEPPTINVIPEFPLHVKILGFKDAIGCKRVVTTRAVPELVIPARPAEPERVVPAHEESVVTWECGAILEPEGVKAEATSDVPF